MASVRIFTDRVVNLRQQEYQGYTLWLLDFWNGTGEHPIYPYRPPGYTSLEIVRFKELSLCISDVAHASRNAATRRDRPPVMFRKDSRQCLRWHG